MTFPIVRTEKVVNDFAQFGQEELEKFSSRRIACFDDLGEEPKESVHYGTRVNVMQQILEERYSRSCITLVTTNHKINELGKMYGAMVESRIPEMFNPIALHGPDRRSMAVDQSLDFETSKK